VASRPELTKQRFRNINITTITTIQERVRDVSPEINNRCISAERFMLFHPGGADISKAKRHPNLPFGFQVESTLIAVPERRRSRLDARQLCKSAGIGSSGHSTEYPTSHPHNIYPLSTHPQVCGDPLSTVGLLMSGFPHQFPPTTGGLRPAMSLLTKSVCPPRTWRLLSSSNRSRGLPSIL
jgi:hypothetical protein